LNVDYGQKKVLRHMRKRNKERTDTVGQNWRKTFQKKRKGLSPLKIDWDSLTDGAGLWDKPQQEKNGGSEGGKLFFK